jgi:uncharacterized membrane protein
MKSLLKNLGLILIAIGAIILIVCFFLGDTNNNAILGGSLATIIIGLIAYIVLNKRIPD